MVLFLHLSACCTILFCLSPPPPRCTPIAPSSEPECRRDPDCADDKYCEPRNLTCSDPCVRWPCGPNMYGTATGHRCPCSCIEGFIRDIDGNCGNDIFLLHLCTKACPFFLSILKIPSFPKYWNFILRF